MEIRLSCVLLAVALLSGCSWFHRGHKAPTEVVAEEPQGEPSIVEPQVTAPRGQNAAYQGQRLRIGRLLTVR